jgi:hypothetical protein
MWTKLNYGVKSKLVQKWIHYLTNNNLIERKKIPFLKIHPQVGKIRIHNNKRKVTSSNLINIINSIIIHIIIN